VSEADPAPVVADSGDDPAGRTTDKAADKETKDKKESKDKKDVEKEKDDNDEGEDDAYGGAYVPEDETGAAEAGEDAGDATGSDEGSGPQDRTEDEGNEATNIDDRPSPESNAGPGRDDDSASDRRWVALAALIVAAVALCFLFIRGRRRDDEETP
jgi:hypothetical protein